MTCDDCREVRSAQLDGEAGPAETRAAAAHLAGCPACQRWERDATRVTRLARVGLPVQSPGVPDRVLDALPSRWRARSVLGLRVLLGLLGLGQVALGLSQLAAPARPVMPGMGPDPVHLAHESVAWSLAVGTAFAIIAARRSRPAGAVPMLSAFLGVLLLLSADDVLAGRVAAARLVGHLVMVLGYLVVVALCHPGLGGSGPSGTAGRRGWRFRLDQPGGTVLAFPRANRHRPAPAGAQDRVVA